MNIIKKSLDNFNIIRTGNNSVKVLEGQIYSSYSTQNYYTVQEASFENIGTDLEEGVDLIYSIWLKQEWQISKILSNLTLEGVEGGVFAKAFTWHYHTPVFTYVIGQDFNGVTPGNDPLKTNRQYTSEIFFSRLGDIRMSNKIMYIENKVQSLFYIPYLNKVIGEGSGD